MRRSICILGLVAVSALAGCRTVVTWEDGNMTANSRVVAECTQLADGTKTWKIDTAQQTWLDGVKKAAGRVLDAFAGIVGKAGVAVD